MLRKQNAPTRRCSRFVSGAATQERIVGGQQIDQRDELDLDEQVACHGVRKPADPVQNDRWLGVVQ